MRKILLLTVMTLPALFAQAKIALAQTDAITFEIPSSIKDEHSHLHEMLGKAAAEKGALGESARHLIDVLHPHFLREEEIASPPLGLLLPLSQGKTVAGSEKILEKTRTLEKEMPQMLADHVGIQNAADQFQKEAEKSGHKDYVEFSMKLKQHVQQEEQILYPAAILVGKYLEKK